MKKIYTISILAIALMFAQSATAQSNSVEEKAKAQTAPNTAKSKTAALTAVSQQTNIQVAPVENNKIVTKTAEVKSTPTTTRQSVMQTGVRPAVVKTQAAPAVVLTEEQQHAQWLKNNTHFKTMNIAERNNYIQKLEQKISYDVNSPEVANMRREIKWINELEGKN